MEKKMEHDLRDGFSQIYVAKKYGVDLKWLTTWWQMHRASKKMDKLAGQLRISPSADDKQPEINDSYTERTNTSTERKI